MTFYYRIVKYWKCKGWRKIQRFNSSICDLVWNFCCGLLFAIYFFFGNFQTDHAKFIIFDTRKWITPACKRPSVINHKFCCFKLNSASWKTRVGSDASLGNSRNFKAHKNMATSDQKLKSRNILFCSSVPEKTLRCNWTHIFTCWTVECTFETVVFNETVGQKFRQELHSF